MAQTGSKKKTAKKKTAAKKKNSRSSKKSGQLSLYDIISKQEFQSTVIFIVGLVLAIIAVFAGGVGSFWNRIHTFYYAVTGLCGFYIPLAVLFFGVVSVLNKKQKVFYVKGAEIFVLFILLCSFVHINKAADINIGYGNAIREIYYSVSTGERSGISSGGVIGAVFGGAVFQVTKSRAVSNIITFILTLGDIMFLFGITLLKLFTQMEKPARKVGEYTGERIEKTKTDIEKRKQIKAVRQQERAASKTDTTIRVVDDFYKNNPEAVTEPETSGRKRARGGTPQQMDMFSSFDELGSFPVHKEDNVPEKNNDPDMFGAVMNRGESRHPEIPHDPVITRQDHDIPSVIADAVPVSPVPEEKKAEKVQPLSEKEAEELNKTLDDALADNKPVVYQKPPLDCLTRPQYIKQNFNENELKANGDKLIAALKSFNVSASIVNVVPGPTVTRYELSPAPGVKISKFVGLSDDLALHMAAPAGLRIEAPIPNKAAIGIEIPNRNKTTVTFREIIDTDKFRNAKSKLNVALGKDIAGDPVFSDLAKMPHLLVAGTTGSGKSVCLNTMIVSLLYNASPDEVKLLLIDPKQVEFGVYNGLPHLLVPVVSDPRKASGALGWAVTEMLSRYKTLNANGVRDIGAYNSLCDEREDLVKMSQIVIFIDELSDLMTVAPAEVEDSIQRLAQMARAAGMHLVVATQRPSVDVITGVIKANIPSRIALTVKSQIDSRTIIDSAGAEKLMGYGDMLYYPVGVPKPIRVQGSYLTDTEIENVVSFIKANGTANYDDNVQQEIERQAAVDKKKAASADADSSGGADGGDDLFSRAVELFVNTPEKASISALQRHLGLGFAKAGRLMDTLEEKGIVGPHEGSKPRKVLITKTQWYEMNAMSSEVTSGEIPETIPAEPEYSEAD